jgi:ribosomal silencing factor RsfS
MTLHLLMTISSFVMAPAIHADALANLARSDEEGLQERGAPKDSPGRLATLDYGDVVVHLFSAINVNIMIWKSYGVMEGCY